MTGLAGMGRARAPLPPLPWKAGAQRGGGREGWIWEVCQAPKQLGNPGEETCGTGGQINKLSRSKAAQSFIHVPGLAASTSEIIFPGQQLKEGAVQCNKSIIILFLPAKPCVKTLLAGTKSWMPELSTGSVTHPGYFQSSLNGSISQDTVT